MRYRKKQNCFWKKISLQRLNAAKSLSGFKASKLKSCLRSQLYRQRHSAYNLLSLKRLLQYKSSLVRKNTSHQQIMDLPPLQADQTYVTFRHPGTYLIAGSSGSGKTSIVQRLIEHRDKMILPNIQKIIWFYGQHQPLHAQLKEEYGDLIEFRHRFPTEMDLMFDVTVPKLVVLDDLINDLKENKGKISRLFTQISHHTNTSVIMISQTLFRPDDDYRTATQNAHHIIVMKSSRAYSALVKLNSDLFGKGTKILQEAYKYVAKKPFGYLYIDQSPHRDEKYSVRTNIFPGEDNIVFVETK